MPTPHTSGHVVLLHGLGRSALAMWPIERYLVARGYCVLNLGYPSRSAPIPELAERVAREVRAWNASERLNFVTHSLGGLIVRYAVAANLLDAGRIRRVVMLGPPNAGSELADQLPQWPIVGHAYRRLTGPAGLQLGTDPEAIPAQLPAVPFETGVIAGTRSFNPLFSAMLNGPNDGKVRVDRTHVAGMQDFLELPYAHPWLMVPAVVHAHIVRFLETGRFR